MLFSVHLFAHGKNNMNRISTSASDNNKRGEIQNSILMEISMF